MRSESSMPGGEPKKPNEGEIVLGQEQLKLSKILSTQISGMIYYGEDINETVQIIAPDGCSPSDLPAVVNHALKGFRITKIDLVESLDGSTDSSDASSIFWIEENETGIEDEKTGAKSESTRDGCYIMYGDGSQPDDVVFILMSAKEGDEALKERKNTDDIVKFAEIQRQYYANSKEGKSTGQRLVDLLRRLRRKDTQ